MLCVARDERSAQGDHFGWHPSTGPDVDERHGHLLVNNLMVAEPGFQRPLLMVWQPPSLCEQLPDPPFSEMDHNGYVLPEGLNQEPLILWSPGRGPDCQEQLTGPDRVHQLHPSYATASILVQDAGTTLFPQARHGNYRLAGDFQAHSVAQQIPGRVMELLGIPAGTAPYIGAFPME